MAESIKKKVSTLIAPSVQIQSYLIEDHRKRYSCCFGRVHVLTATKLIASICALLVLCETFNLANTIASRRFDESLGVATQCISLLIGALVLVLLTAGLVLEKNTLLLPYIVSTILATAFVAAVDLFFFVLLIGNFDDVIAALLSKDSQAALKDEEGEPGETDASTLRAAVGIAIVILTMIVVIQSFQLHIVIRCYRYLKEERAHRRRISRTLI